MNSASQLLNDDQCRLRAYYSQRWQAPTVRSVEALYEAIEAGLTAESDAPWDVAEQAFYDLATTRGLDSAQTDLLGEASHLASLASMVTFLLRPERPWKRPEAVKLPDGSTWEPASFLSQSEGHLRRLVLCGRWDAYRMIQEEHDWRTLEGAIYGVPVDLVVVVLGQERDGRRHGPLSCGWRHPVSKTLRFKKRGGDDFGSSWERVWREQDHATREEWLDALVQDGLLPECVLIHPVEVQNRDAILHLAEAKLSRIQQTKTAPEPQLSRCFDRFHLCPYRSCCPRGLEPSPELGFLPTSSIRA
jgi:hypothetical protein